MLQGKPEGRASPFSVGDLALKEVTRVGKILRVVRQHVKLGAHVYCSQGYPFAAHHGPCLHQPWIRFSCSRSRSVSHAPSCCIPRKCIRQHFLVLAHMCCALLHNAPEPVDVYGRRASDVAGSVARLCQSADGRRRVGGECLQGKGLWPCADHGSLLHESQAHGGANLLWC